MPEVPRTENRSAVEGRWLLWFDHLVRHLIATGPRPEPLGIEGATPVVPCDDAAIERAVAAVREMATTGLRSRDIVATVFRAAGETER